MACHLAGVPTAVATCGTAFGSEHIKVLRRLLMDQDECAARSSSRSTATPPGRRPRCKAFDGRPALRHPDLRRRRARRLRPVRAAAGPRATRRSATWSPAASRCSSSRSRTALRAATTWRRRRGGSAALAAAAPRGRQDQGPRAASGVRPPPRRLARHGRGDRAGAGSARAQQRPARGRRPRRRPARRTRPAADARGAGTVEREVLKPSSSARPRRPAFDGARERGLHRTRATRRSAAWCAKAAWPRRHAGGEAWIAALREAAPTTGVRTWSPSWRSSRCAAEGEADTRYAEALLCRLQEIGADARIAELKARLQRLNPVEEPERVHAKLFGELVAWSRRSGRCGSGRRGELLTGAGRVPACRPRVDPRCSRTTCHRRRAAGASLARGTARPGRCHRGDRTRSAPRARRARPATTSSLRAAAPTPGVEVHGP